MDVYVFMCAHMNKQPPMILHDKWNLVLVRVELNFSCISLYIDDPTYAFFMTLYRSVIKIDMNVSAS